MDNQLIQIYLLGCQIYDSHSSLKYQRASNFKPVFSDEVNHHYLFVWTIKRKVHSSANL